MANNDEEFKTRETEAFPYNREDIINIVLNSRKFKTDVHSIIHPELEKKWEEGSVAFDSDLLKEGNVKSLIFKLNETNQLGELYFEVGIAKVYASENSTIVYFDELVHYLYSTDLSDPTLLKDYKFGALDITNENICFFSPDVCKGTIAIDLETQVKLVI